MPTAVDVPTGPDTHHRTSTWDGLRFALIAAWLLLLVTALAVGHRPEQPDDAFVSTVWGLEVPTWLGLTALATALATALVGLVHLVRGSEPWRATRWAWFWLAANPLGVLAYLLLAGPTPGISQPSSRPRLTGGWAFLIGSAVSTALLNKGLR